MFLPVVHDCKNMPVSCLVKIGNSPFQRLDIIRVGSKTSGSKLSGIHDKTGMIVDAPAVPNVQYSNVRDDQVPIIQDDSPCVSIAAGACPAKNGDPANSAKVDTAVT
jgi:hypothetical protein